jgi:hypothetical protein
MAPAAPLLLFRSTVVLAGPSCLPVAVLLRITVVDPLRWIGRILRIFVFGLTCVVLDRLVCLLAAPVEG